MPVKPHISNFVWTSAFFGILATLVNYQFGGNDHIEQLPIVYRSLDETFLTNDFFTNSTSGFSPRFYYSKLIGGLSSLIGIPWTFFLGTLISNIATSVLTYLSGNKLFGDENSGIFAAALVMLIPTISMGGDQILYASLFTPTTLVFPLILLSFYLLLQKKILFCVTITGIVSLFHVLIGLEYGALFLSTFIITQYLEDRNLKRALKNAGFFLIIVAFLLPNLIPHFQHSSSIESDVFIEILANFRHPHHYVLSEILTGKEIGKLILILFILVLLLRHWKKSIRTSYHIRYIQFIGISLGFAVLLNWIFIELIPSKLITSLQLLRLLNIGKWIFLFLLANHFAVSIQNKKFNPRVILGIALLGLLIFASEISWQKVLGIGIIFYGVLFLLLKGQKTPLFAAFAVLIGLILAVNYSEYSPIKKYQKTYLASNYLTKNQSKLVDFINQNTSKESVFLAPHLFGFVRTEAQRAIVVDYKAFPFKETAMVEWHQRIEDCYGLDKQSFEKRYKNISDVKILELQKKYPFDYAIIYQETSTKMPIIYSDSKYKVIDLTSYAQ